MFNCFKAEHPQVEKRKELVIPLEGFTAKTQPPTILVLEHRSNGDISELTSVTPRQLYSYIKMNVSKFAESAVRTPEGLSGGQCFLLFLSSTSLTCIITI